MDRNINMAYTEYMDGIARAIYSNAYIMPSDKSNGGDALAIPIKTLWDTGATNSCISDKVVRELNLEPVDVTVVNTANGKQKFTVYEVDVRLPNYSYLRKIKVINAKLEPEDMLIGMDVITRGDFAITNVDGKTTFSFRTPSQETIDYGDERTESKKFIDEHSLSDEELWEIVQEHRNKNNK